MTGPEKILERVVLAISAFRSDAAVIRLLRLAFADGAPRFGAVVVVDSLGSGAIASAIAEHGWPVEYHDAETNLGSAGNLDRRLRTAAATGLDWCLALNHDASLDPAKAAQLVNCGEQADRVGAVYPRLRFISAGGRLDRPRTGFGTLGRLADPDLPDPTPIEVAWSSSNGALYRLDAVRDGLKLWPELWMGYEDLAIGWELRRAGWRQYLCREVVVDDNYEFRAVRLAGRTIHLADKPVWYSYYQLRNLALIARGSAGRAVSWPAVARRAVIDSGLLLLRRDRMARARLLWSGLADGVRGRSGQGPVP